MVRTEGKQVGVESFEDKVYLITGGSSGLGLAAARALVTKGASVALMARRESRLSDACVSLGSRALPLAGDVADKRAVGQCMSAAVEHFGGLDGVVTCAGLTFSYPVEDLPEDRLRSIVDVSLLGTVFSCQVAIPYLRERGGGHLVTVSSASVRHRNEFPHMAIYAAVKAAVEKFTFGLRDEVKRDGIGVTCISPGAFDTDIFSNFDDRYFSEAYEIWRRDHGPESDGVGDPTYFGEAVSHCLSYPPGMAVDFMEIRPNVPTAKS